MKIVQNQTGVKLTDTLMLKDWDLIHGGPTAGKTTLIANCNRVKLIDPDVLIWGPALSAKINQALKDNGVEPWHTKGTQRLVWNVVERAVQMSTHMLAHHTGAKIMTNLFFSDTLGDFERIWRLKFKQMRKITFFRGPEEMYNLAKARAMRSAEAKNKPLVWQGTQDVFNSWYEGWLKHTSSYDVAIQLEPGEYLTDIFGYKAIIVDEAAQSEAYARVAELFRDFYGYLPPVAVGKYDVGFVEHKSTVNKIFNFKPEMPNVNE